MPLRTIVEQNCYICGVLMLKGEPSRPLDIGEKKWSWSHLYCVADDDERLPVCKHISKNDGSNKCIYYENGGNKACSFRHLKTEEGVEALQKGVVKVITIYIIIIIFFNIIIIINILRHLNDIMEMVFESEEE